MTNLNKIRSDDYDWKSFTKEEQKEILIELSNLSKDYEEAIVLGFFPAKYAGANTWLCKILN